MTDFETVEKVAPNLPWVEKYRPNALDELISHEEIEAANKRLEEARRSRSEREAGGQEFLKKVINRTVTYIEQCEEIEKRTSASLIDQIKKRIAEIKLTSDKIVEKCTDLK